jgi:hypothetical protein
MFSYGARLGTLRDAPSLPVTAVVSGNATMDRLRKNALVATAFKPLALEEKAASEQRCSSRKEYEYYRQWAYHDRHSSFARYARELVFGVPPSGGAARKPPKGGTPDLPHHMFMS